MLNEGICICTRTHIYIVFVRVPTHFRQWLLSSTRIKKAVEDLSIPFIAIRIGTNRKVLRKTFSSPPPPPAFPPRRTPRVPSTLITRTTKVRARPPPLHISHMRYTPHSLEKLSTITNFVCIFPYAAQLNRACSTISSLILPHAPLAYLHGFPTYVLSLSPHTHTYI